MADFELATRLGLTFETPKGILDIHDLWSLPLESNTGRANLDDIAKSLNAKLQATSQSFVNAKTQVSEADQLAFDVVKRVIEWRLSENQRKADEAGKAEKKRLLLEALAAKEREGIMGMSKEQLEAAINAL